MAKEIPEGVHVTYRLEYRRCGKYACPCMRDKSKRHGPYWYAWWRENGIQVSSYIGKVHPRDAAVTTVKEEQTT